MPAKIDREAAILSKADRVGYSYVLVGKALGLSTRQVEGSVRNFKARWDTGKEAWHPVAHKMKLEDVLEPRAYVHPFPRIESPVLGDEPYVTVVFGDTHMGFEDKRALRVVLSIIAELRPDCVIHNGDLLDCYHLSTFDKNPDRLYSLQIEIDKGRELLHQIAQVAPKARRILLEGNHEHRLTKQLWRLSGAARVFARLRITAATLTWPVQLGLDEIGFEFVPYREQGREMLLPRLIVKHGDRLSAFSGYTARKEHDLYGCSGLSGHTHRLGTYYTRDKNGNHVWQETGCTCGVIAEYAPTANWQQGCVVITHVGNRFNMEPIYIEKGQAIFRGELFKA